MSLRNKNQETDPCWGRIDHALALRIELPSLENYLSPYTQLSHVHLTQENGKGALTIHFNDFTVIITGEQLKDILFNLQKQILEWIKVSKTDPHTKNRLAIITSIEIEMAH